MILNSQIKTPRLLFIDRYNEWFLLFKCDLICDFVIKEPILSYCRPAERFNALSKPAPRELHSLASSKRSRKKLCWFVAENEEVTWMDSVRTLLTTEWGITGFQPV